MSKSSALSMSALLIFEMEEKNGILLFNVNYLPYESFSGSATVIVPFTTIYASE